MSSNAPLPQAMAGEGAVDCHVHVFDDLERFPLRIQSAYEPPFSPVPRLLETAAAAGIERFVLVQPTPYGDDLSLLQASLATLGARAKGVGVAGASTGAAELERMRQAGIVALRFVETRLADGSRMGGTVPLDALFETLAPRLRELNMHAEIWAPLAETLARRKQLEKTGIPIVLDHMGGFDPRAGTSHKDFRELLALLRNGAVWVKLATCRRLLGSDPQAIRAFHDDMVEANSERLVWASDFPFVRYPGTPPTVTNLMDQFHSWMRDQALARGILSRNPARLYQFAIAPERT